MIDDAHADVSGLPRPPRGRPAGPRLAVQLVTDQVYTAPMDVGVTEFRAHLSTWIEKVRHGDEVVITDRGVPVARLRGLTTSSALERLVTEGVIAPPKTARRPRAAGRVRGRSRRPLSDVVGEQRR